MTFDSLGKLDFPDDQVLGLTIAFKHDANDKRTTATSPEEYLAQFVVAKMQDFAVNLVTGEQLNRIFTAEKIAFENQETTKLQQVAAILGVSLVIDPPADVKP